MSPKYMRASAQGSDRDIVAGKRSAARAFVRRTYMSECRWLFVPEGPLAFPLSTSSPTNATRYEKRTAPQRPRTQALSDPGPRTSQMDAVLKEKCAVFSATTRLIEFFAVSYGRADS